MNTYIFWIWLVILGIFYRISCVRFGVLSDKQFLFPALRHYSKGVQRNCISNNEQKLHFLHDIRLNHNQLVKSDNIYEYRKDCYPISNYFHYLTREILLKYNNTANLKFADSLIAMRGVLLLSIVNNASVCFENSKYFTFMNNSLQFLKCNNNSVYNKWNEEFITTWIKNRKCNYGIKKSTEITITYDMTIYISYCDNFIDDLITNTNNLKSKHYREITTKYLFYPRESVIEKALEVLSTMGNNTIGIDINIDNSHYPVLNPYNSSTLIYNSISQIIKKTNEYDNTFSIYISSNIPNIKQYFNHLNKSIIFHDDIPCQSSNEEYKLYERDVLSVYILSQCKILMYTSQSQKASIAKEISSTNTIFSYKV